MSARYLAKVAVIAALYAALTLALAPISYGALQFRVSEALTVLPFITPAAIPGLTIGCIIANMLGPGLGIVDIVFGSLATLIAALLTWRSRKVWLAPLPPVVANGIIIGILINYVFKAPLLPSMASVAFGELVVCYLLGYPLLLLIGRNRALRDLLTDDARPERART
ncbi:MAG: QueT transporter family protein [Chloroflexota bacterium]